MSSQKTITLMEHVPLIIKADIKKFLTEGITEEMQQLQNEEHNLMPNLPTLSQKAFIKLMRTEDIDDEPHTMEEVMEELDQITSIITTNLVFGQVNQNEEIPYYKVYLTSTQQTIPGLHGYIKKPWTSYEELYTLYCNVLSQ